MPSSVVDFDEFTQAINTHPVQAAVLSAFMEFFGTYLGIYEMVILRDSIHIYLKNEAQYRLVPSSAVGSDAFNPDINTHHGGNAVFGGFAKFFELLQQTADAAAMWSLKIGDPEYDGQSTHACSLTSLLC